MEATNGLNGGNSTNDTTTVEASLAAIERRLANVETIGRRWRAAAMVLAVGMVCVVGMGADEPFPKVVKANAFIVTDENGKMAGIFGYASRDVDIRLGMNGRDGKSAIGLLPGFEAIKTTLSDGTVKYIE